MTACSLKGLTEEISTAIADEPTETVTPQPIPTATIAPLPEYLVEYQKSCSTPLECAEKLVKMGWKYYSDSNVYGERDFAASPAVSLNKNDPNKRIKMIGGDCEDFAMADLFGVLDDGYAPLVIYLVSKTPVLNDAMVVYKEGDKWKFVSLFVSPNIHTISSVGLEGKIVSEWGTLDALFYDYNKHRGNIYYLYYLYDLTKSQEEFIKKHSINIDWRTTEQEVPLISEGIIDQGPK